ncbi:hypothetical protein M5K25_022353 [Dendrobium thyrsiflorum]|uniref:Uncharacterized protein n=1 Tax=Dendrobium thyrsiflorum TaxID=117978 RepID=A0ABD0UC27_DENTH
MNQIKTTVEERMSSMEGQVADLRDMIKKMLEVHNQTAASVAKSGEGRSTNSEIRREEEEQDELGLETNVILSSGAGGQLACYFLVYATSEKGVLSRLQVPAGDARHCHRAPFLRPTAAKKIDALVERLDGKVGDLKLESEFQQSRADFRICKQKTHLVQLLLNNSTLIQGCKG